MSQADVAMSTFQREIADKIPPKLLEAIDTGMDELMAHAIAEIGKVAAITNHPDNMAPASFIAMSVAASLVGQAAINAAERTKAEMVEVMVSTMPASIQRKYEEVIGRAGPDPGPGTASFRNTCLASYAVSGKEGMASAIRAIHERGGKG